MAGLRPWLDVRPSGVPPRRAGSQHVRPRDVRETWNALYHRDNDLPVWAYILLGMAIGLTALFLAGLLATAAILAQHAAG